MFYVLVTKGTYSARTNFDSGVEDYRRHVIEFVAQAIEGFHVTSLQQNLPSHAAPSGHVGSHKIWRNSLLLKLHKA